MPARTARSPIYQLKITLKGSKPPIWRRVQVPGTSTLGELHQIIQEALGWWNCHLHEFTIDGVPYGDPDTDEFGESLNENSARLNRLGLAPRSRFRYQYDFGDDWQHEILVEQVLPPERGVFYPRCIAGRRACPPEDCGGIWGYYDHFLPAIRDPSHPEYDEMREWIGREFDPNAFDLEATNARVQNPISVRLD